MANKPNMGYSSAQANELLMGLPGAMATETGRMLKATKTGLGNVWNSMDTTSKAATIAGLVPGIGDAVGVANDARLFYQNPETRTPINYGLSAAGLLPLIPSMGVVKGMGKGMAGSIVPPVDVVKSIKPKPIKAPASDVGFYSPVEKAALNLNRNQGSGQSFLNDLKKGENVKGDELTYTKLEDWLKTKPNLTRQEVQDYIANNKLDVKEVQLSGTARQLGMRVLISRIRSSDRPSRQSRQRNRFINQYHVYSNDPSLQGTDDSLQGIYDTAEEADAFVKQHNSQFPYGPSKYDQDQLPNGDNYKEILLTLPEKTRPATLAEVNAAKAKISDRLELMTQKEYDDLVRSGEVPKINSGEGEIQYQSSHWDEPNVLAHIRTNQRLDVNGRKTTLIEEVQSDLHQAGRKKGYGKNGVPNAPFKEDWYKLALKRAIKEAVDNGSDSISLTTGSRQAERYDLSKQIKTIVATPNEKGLIELEAFDLNNIPVINKEIYPDELESHVGKELAANMLKEIDPSMVGQQIITREGLDLKVGGEGMKKYYDEIYPAFLNKFGKKYGVKVEDNIIDIGTPEKVYTLQITPQMREDVLKGQPLTSNAQDKNQYYA